MDAHAYKTQENKNQPVTNEVHQKQLGGSAAFQLVDNRPEAIAQRKLIEMANNSPRVKKLAAYQEMMDNRPQAKKAAQLQTMADNFSAKQKPPLQKKENKTGLPDHLKSGIENLSGQSMDDVNVHYNSSKPAQLNAHAYAQGTDIHISPGQEKHLPHEAWHVAQQKQGRVKPTTQFKNHLQINDDKGLEKEADIMGNQAALFDDENAHAPAQLFSSTPLSTNTIQLRWLVDTEKRAYFWEEDGNEREPAPSALSQFKEVAAPMPGTYSVDSGARGIPLYLSLDLYLLMNKGSTRAPSDTYNPFGRFDSSATVVAFLPGHGISPEVIANAMDNLRARIPHIANVKTQSANYVRGYPDHVITESDQRLTLTSATALGAVYSDKEPAGARARHDPSKARDPGELNMVGEAEPTKVALNTLEPKSLAYWEGQERSVQQGQVMGASAADCAANAGYERDEGAGWEWLHLIAHSMGGIAIVGPQVAENLVCGTSECNTEMIIVEEFIKDVVRRGQQARLAVFADMSDRQRHIAGRITYDFLIMDNEGYYINAYHWTFDPLSRVKPLVETNIGHRYVARGLFEGVKGKKFNTVDDSDEIILFDDKGLDQVLEERKWYAGTASPDGNMCLLDTLSQLLDAVNKDELRAFFINAGIIQLGQMIDIYNPLVTQALAAHFHVRFQVHQWDGAHLTDGAVIGNEGEVLHLLHSGMHFVPLWNDHE